MSKPIIILFLLSCFTKILSAQVNKTPQQSLGVIYNTETTFNFKLGTNKTMSAALEFGKLQTYYRTRFYHFGVGELRHIKEQRQSVAPTASRSFRPFVYGKQNNLLVARVGWGTKRYYSEKAKKKGVAIGTSYTFGPTLGLLKPYYLALRRTSGTDAQGRVSHEKYSEENKDLFLNNSTHILGASGFSRGVKELSLLPGGNASIALHFDWGAFDEVVKALEIGIQADIFLKKAPILVTEENNQAFFNFFVNLQFGKRK